TRRRTKQMKAEQEEKASKTVPGVKVLLQGGLYGTIVEYDPVNLDQPARVEIAPGTVIEVHSQAILRIVEDDAAAEEIEPEGVEPAGTVDATPLETPEETRARLERDSDDK